MIGLLLPVDHDPVDGASSVLIGFERNNGFPADPVILPGPALSGFLPLMRSWRRGIARQAAPWRCQSPPQVRSGVARQPFPCLFPFCCSVVVGVASSTPGVFDLGNIGPVTVVVFFLQNR